MKTGKRVLVAGATGYLGSYLVKAFNRHAYHVRALTRNREKLKHLAEYVDETFTAEITKPNSLRGICDDIDIVISSIGITRQKDNLTYMDVDYRGNCNLLTEAVKSKVSRFIYISGLHKSENRILKIIQAKLKFESQLINSGLDYLIVRANGFFSDMKEYLKMAQKGRGYVFGSGDYKINPIHGEDLAQFCIEQTSIRNKIVEVGGPDICTHNEALEIAFNILGKPKKIIHVPLWIKSIALILLRTFTSVKTYGPLEFFITVLSQDMVAPVYGNHHLADYYKKIKAGL